LVQGWYSEQDLEKGLVETGRQATVAAQVFLGIPSRAYQPPDSFTNAVY